MFAWAEKRRKAKAKPPTDVNYIGMWESLTHPKSMTITSEGMFSFENKESGHFCMMQGTFSFHLEVQYLSYMLCR